MIRSVGANNPLATSLNQNLKQVKQQDKKIAAQQEDRVAKISAAIQNGDYKLELQKTSEKMALNLLNL